MAEKSQKNAKKFQDFFRIIARVFYDTHGIVVMDCITHLYFINKV